MTVCPGPGPAAGQLREDGPRPGAAPEQQLRADVAARTLFPATTSALRCRWSSSSGPTLLLESGLSGNAGTTSRIFKILLG